MTSVTMTWKVVRSDWDLIHARMEHNAQQIVAKAALDWEAQAKIRAAVRTGTMKNSIQATKVGPYEWVIRVNVEYGAYVEYGTVRAPAQPFFGPAGAIVRPQFMAALKQILR